MQRWSPVRPLMDGVSGQRLRKNSGYLLAKSFSSTRIAVFSAHAPRSIWFSLRYGATNVARSTTACRLMSCGASYMKSGFGDRQAVVVVGLRPERLLGLDEFALELLRQRFGFEKRVPAGRQPDESGNRKKGSGSFVKINEPDPFPRVSPPPASLKQISEAQSWSSHKAIRETQADTHRAMRGKIYWQIDPSRRSRM